MRVSLRNDERTSLRLEPKVKHMFRGSGKAHGDQNTSGEKIGNNFFEIIFRISLYDEKFKFQEYSPCLAESEKPIKVIKPVVTTTLAPLPIKKQNDELVQTTISIITGNPELVPESIVQDLEKSGEFSLLVFF